MKKITLLSALLLMFLGHAQEEPEEDEIKPSKFSYNMDLKLGFSQMHSRELPSIQGNSMALALNFSYEIFNDFNLITGVQFTEVGANYLDANLDASFILIPLKFRDRLISNDADDAFVKPYYGFGLFTNHLRRLTVDSEALGRNRETGIGWNFGWSVEIGATIDYSTSSAFGIGIEAQNDFTNMGDRSKRFHQTFLMLTWVTKF